MYRISKQIAQAKVSILQTDERIGFRYNGRMKKHQAAQWLNDALASSGIKQAELARALAARGVIDDNRSIVNKMAKGDREISVEELFAISEITGYPIPVPGGDDEIGGLASAIRAAPESKQQQIIGVVRALLSARATP